MEDIRSIVALSNFSFGELLLTIPALRALKERFPSATITLAVDPSATELAGVMDCVDDVIIWESREHSFKETLVFSAQIKGRNFDMAVIFNPSQAAHFVCSLAKIPVRLGYDKKQGYLLTHKVKDERDLALKHEVEYNLDLVALVGAYTKDRSISLKVRKTGFLEGLKGSCVIAVHPWASDPAKQWPLDRFRELIKRLAGFDIVLVGGTKELVKYEDFFHGIHEIVINLTGKTNLLELAGVLKNTNLLISGDSGPVHLAAAVGTPVVDLLSSDVPGKAARRWGPWGEGHTVIEKNKLEEISINEVVRAVKDKLNFGTSSAEQ